MTNNLSEVLNKRRLNKNQIILNKIINIHPKQILYYKSYDTDRTIFDNVKPNRIFLYFYKIKFLYTTNKGNQKEDIRLYILDKTLPKDEIEKVFYQTMLEYNEKHKYRILSNLVIKDIQESNMSDFKVLQYIENLNTKDKNRVLTNFSSEGCVLLYDFLVEYTTQKGTIRKSKFILPLAGYEPGSKITNKEITFLINQNKQRKVSNVKILDTKALTFIKL